MYTLSTSDMTLSVDFSAASVASLILGGRERVTAKTPLFRVGLRDRAGSLTVLDAHASAARTAGEGTATYTDFPVTGLTVTVTLSEAEGGASWGIHVETPADFCAEWVDFPLLSLPHLIDNDPASGGRVLLPYNEGALISDLAVREMTDFRHWEPAYPSLGCYAVFPNMISSQMLAYLWEDAGLYVGVHDPDRGVKQIDFYREAEDKGVTLLTRLYCGVDFGETFTPAYPVIWKATENGRWESAAEIYRDWFEANLPPKAVKIKDDPTLPTWYAESPLVVSYPVRGKHDMDDMTPNALYPYTNALPILEEIRAVTQSRLLVLLMHWEGTAPWAPPYVWPPFGGEENFNLFRDTLHSRGDLLGVYCSGFGYTKQSNLVADYNREQDYEERGLEAAMCAAPDGIVGISNICRAQRSGYDICPASPLGRELLKEAYSPLFTSGIDYAQILDQNHGGGQYFCYSREHGHPPVPGSWMTAHMQDMLSEWNREAPDMLFGCESAAAEPFIGNLRLSDNRFELNYHMGEAVPLYAYLYHEYLRNFMGNQVSCATQEDSETLFWRTAYSFVAGDALTLVLTPDGEFLSFWGQRDFTKLPGKPRMLRLLRNLTRLYREEAKPFLSAGRMITASPVESGFVEFPCTYSANVCRFPRVLSTAWEAAGRRARVLVNPSPEEAVCRINGREYRIPALDGMVLPLD